MKRIIILAAGILLSAAAASVLISENIERNSIDEMFNANVEALADVVEPECTGPKKENIAGHIFCKC